MNRLLSIRHIFICVALLLVPVGVPAQTRISIVSWNLENFGRTKSEKTVQFIAQTINCYDIVAIQEVVGERGGIQAVHRLVLALNNNNPAGPWKSTVSNMTTGSAYQSERYAYLWNTSKIKIINTGWLDQKYALEIEREPFLARFACKKDTFTLVNFHSVPKKRHPEHEIKYLKFFPAEYPDYNLLFMGDFNTSHRNNVFNPLKSKGYRPVLKRQKTTLRMECIKGDCLASEYDNIFYNDNKIRFIRSEIIPFYRLYPDMKSARKVSDHVPVVFTFAVN